VDSPKTKQIIEPVIPYSGLLLAKLTAATVTAKINNGKYRLDRISFDFDSIVDPKAIAPQITTLATDNHGVTSDKPRFIRVLLSVLNTIVKSFPLQASHKEISQSKL
jgi:hypothetical protein